MTNSIDRFELITNDKFKKAFKPSCTVKMDCTVDVLTTFVTVGYDSDLDSFTLLHNSDIDTLWYAMNMTRTAFYKKYDSMSAKEQKAFRGRVDFR